MQYALSQPCLMTPFWVTHNAKRIGKHQCGKRLSKSKFPTSIRTGWWYTYPFEKWWSSSVGIIIPNIIQYMESHKMPWFQSTNQRRCQFSDPACTTSAARPSFAGLASPGRQNSSRSRKKTLGEGRKQTLGFRWYSNPSKKNGGTWWIHAGCSSATTHWEKISGLWWIYSKQKLFEKL